MLFYLCVEDFFLLTLMYERHIRVAVSAVCLVQESMSALAMEALTVLAVGPLCLLAVYGIVYRRLWRHLLQVC